MIVASGATAPTTPLPQQQAMSLSEAAELEAFNAAAQRIGHTARAIECNMVESFAAVNRAALGAAYPWSGKPPVWLPLTPARRSDPTMGRKRRWRRARGRQIEARRNPPYVGGPIWVIGRQAGLRSDRSKWATLLFGCILDEADSFNCGLTEEQARAEIAAETERWRKLIDSLMGDPWEEQADV